MDGSTVIAALDAAGCPFTSVPFTREAWESEFGGGAVDTPFGPTPVSPEQVSGDPALLGLIRPTLEQPAYIVRRDAGATFHRAIVAPDGSSRGYAAVTMGENNLHVSISTKPVDADLLVTHAGAITADVGPDGEAVFKSLSLLSVAQAEMLSGGGGKLPQVAQVAVTVLDFDLASAIMGWGGEFFKSDYGPPPPGSRWITVHPNGSNSKGVPVLVQPVKDGSGHMRVIAGAGGKLNMLKLRGVKDPSEYRTQHAERAAAKRQRIKDQIHRDKELGLHDAKVLARKQLNESRRKAQVEFIQTVAEAMGWEPATLHPETEGLSPAAQKKAQGKLHADLLAKAKAAVSAQRKVLVADADRRAEAGLGLVSLSEVADQLSAQDLDPVRESDGSGIRANFASRAAANGLDQASLDAKVAEAKAGEVKASPNPSAMAKRAETAEAIRQELSGMHMPQLQTSIVEADKAVALIKAQKKLAAVEQAARAANAEVDASTVEPKAYVLTVSDDAIDKAALATVEEDLRAARASAFLAGVDQVGGEDRVEAHIATGAYNAINAVSQTVGGTSMLDRSVVDVLGIAGAAQVLARRLHMDRPGDAEAIREAIADYHVAQQSEAQAEALAQAKALQAKAAEIEQSEAANASDLAVASALNAQRQEYLGQARKVMGQALGEMEAHASLVAAMHAGPQASLDVSLGKTGLDSAVKQLWALGLNDDDFEMQRVEGNVFARVYASGLDKLSAPVDDEGLAKVRRNLAIMNGEQDEDDWLPSGFARRADLGLDLKPGVSPTLAEPFEASAPDLAAALRAYIGGRTADGDRAADILADVQSASFFGKVGAARSGEYRKALDAVIPTKDGKRMQRVEALAPHFDAYADDFVQSKWGGQRSTLNRQSFEPNALAQEALHRALSDEPTGKVAYKPIGELSLSERGQLRDWFYRHVAKESPQEAKLRQARDGLASAEPEKFTTDLFGATSVSPDWTEWKSSFDAAQAQLADAKLDWNRYAKMMHGKVRALEAVQDLIRSRISGTFADHYNRLRPDAPLKVGKTVIRGNLNHLSAIDPGELKKRLSQERALIDGLRNRIGGKYALGTVAEKIEATKEHEAAMGQAQMGFFSSEEAPVQTGGNYSGSIPLSADERRTIGHAAENMVSKMMGAVGANFEPGKPVKLFRPSMSGPDGVKRQRMIKMIAQNKRVIGAAGVGSGKTAIGLGAFADLHSSGKAKKGLFVVPSIVQEQFGGEALRFLDPGKFKWHAEAGASYEDRMAAYKDPGTHFSVVTHQSFRDDLLRMGVEAGIAATPEAMADHLATLDNPGRKALTRQILDHHGIDWQFVMADEAHGLLDREGKSDSRMSQAIAGVTDNSPYYFHASGDPVKNDASEAFSLLQKMDPERYADRGAFMRRYGGDTRAAADGLKRELARHLYAFSLKPDVAVSTKEVSIKPSDAQQAALAGVDKAAAALRIARMSGYADVEAAKQLAPAMFEGVDEALHESLAADAAKSVGILKAAAERRVLDTHPASAKLDHLAKAAAERKGQQGVVFAHSLAAVEMIRKRLEADGHRVVTLTGKDSAADKGAKIQKFRPDKGDAEADIIVCSDAGATGANLQSGRWLAQYDTPDTAMTHAQRRGRIHRIGQQNAVELLDLVSDHPSERRARKRLANKYDLRDLLTSPLDGLDDTGLAYHLAQRGIGAPKPVQASLF